MIYLFKHFCMECFELYLPPVPVTFKQKRRTTAIIWTDEMLFILRSEFATTFNKDLAKKLGVGWRTLVRKARALGLEKEPGFLDNKRTEIVKLVLAAKKPQPTKGLKGWSVPNSENTRFKPGNISPMATDPLVVEKCRASRNKTIRREIIRIKCGLKPLTKLKLKVY